MRSVLKGLVMSVIALAMIGATIPAYAKAPFKEVFIDQSIFTLPDIPCGSFTLTEVMDSESVTVTTFFDKAGVDPVKVGVRVPEQLRFAKALTGLKRVDLVAGAGELDYPDHFSSSTSKSSSSASGSV